MAVDDKKNVKVERISESEGSKFMVIESVENSETGLRNVSPILMKKQITFNCGEEPKSIKGIQRGRKIVIETKDKKQAIKLIKLSEIILNDGTKMKVKVFENRKLNSTKGVIYCPQLIYDTDSEIVKSIEEENVIKVIEINRFQKKLGDKKIDTGTFFVTFEGKTLPEKINVGYLRLNVKQYIPAPLRCFRCLRFGHTAMNCRLSHEESICVNCSELKHTELGEKCHNDKHCNNCGSTEHNTISRICPEYKKNVAINEIKSKFNISIFEAKLKYEASGPIQHGTYAQITKNITYNKPKMSNTHMNLDQRLNDLKNSTREDIMEISPPKGMKRNMVANLSSDEEVTLKVTRQEPKKSKNGK